MTRLLVTRIWQRKILGCWVKKASDKVNRRLDWGKWVVAQWNISSNLRHRTKRGINVSRHSDVSVMSTSVECFCSERYRNIYVHWWPVIYDWSKVSSAWRCSNVIILWAQCTFQFSHNRVRNARRSNTFRCWIHIQCSFTSMHYITEDHTSSFKQQTGK